MSEKILPKPGTYHAKRSGPIIIAEYESGSAAACVPYTLLNCDVEFIGGIAKVFIILKDGSPSTKGLEVLKRVFPAWTSANVYDLETIDLPAEDSGAEFILAECSHRAYKDKDGNEQIGFEVGYFNALGDTGSMTPMNEDARKAFIAKNGAKLRALLGASKSAAPKTTAKSETKTTTTAPVSKGPPGRKNVASQVRTSTEDEVWAAVVAKYPDETKNGEDAEFMWNALEEILKSNGRSLDKGDVATIQEWGAVATKLEV